MRRMGVLSYRLLMFEKDDGGGFMRAGGVPGRGARRLRLARPADARRVLGRPRPRAARRARHLSGRRRPRRRHRRARRGPRPPARRAGARGPAPGGHDGQSRDRAGDDAGARPRRARAARALAGARRAGPARGRHRPGGAGQRPGHRSRPLSRTGGAGSRCRSSSGRSRRRSSRSPARSRPSATARRGSASPTGAAGSRSRARPIGCSCTRASASARRRTLVPYLARLGVSHCYCSPFLKARPGSTHGYDVVDHNAFNPELGSDEDFARFTAALRAHGVGLVIDVVPNHMGVMGADNAWWLDVLENGPASVYAPYFDIDWAPAKTELRGKLLLPLLGGPYGTVLERGDLVLRFDAAAGEFNVHYFGHRLPVAPREYPRLLRGCSEAVDRRLGRDSQACAELASLVTAFANLPPRTVRSAEKILERHRDRQLCKRRLARLCAEVPAVAELIAEVEREYNGVPGDPRSFDALHALLEAQPYRLADWRAAADEINYRRFFDINDLAAVRVEDPTRLRRDAPAGAGPAPVGPRAGAAHRPSRRAARSRGVLRPPAAARRARRRRPGRAGDAFRRRRRARRLPGGREDPRPRRGPPRRLAGARDHRLRLHEPRQRRAARRRARRATCCASTPPSSASGRTSTTSSTAASTWCCATRWRASLPCLPTSSTGSPRATGTPATSRSTGCAPRWPRSSPASRSTGPTSPKRGPAPPTASASSGR